jgi:hypothetical protein
MTENKRDFAADLAICNAATAGPWVADKVGIVYDIFAEDGDMIADILYEKNDARFIAEAREGWPAALAEIKRLKTSVDGWFAEANSEALRADIALAEIERLTEALREIDTHIRSTSDPIPYIVATLKRALLEYEEALADV